MSDGDTGTFGNLADDHLDPAQDDVSYWESRGDSAMIVEGDDGHTELVIDTDGDGQADMVQYDADNSGQLDAVAWSSHHDGQIDHVEFDSDHDGKVDVEE